MRAAVADGGGRGRDDGGDQGRGRRKDNTTRLGFRGRIVLLEVGDVLPMMSGNDDWLVAAAAVAIADWQ